MDIATLRGSWFIIGIGNQPEDELIVYLFREEGEANQETSYEKPSFGGYYKRDGFRNPVERAIGWCSIQAGMDEAWAQERGEKKISEAYDAPIR